MTSSSAPAAAGSRWPVALYVPNLIGYVRVVTAILAAIYWRNTALFLYLYGTSYLLDAVDGEAARRLKQTSRFGAVLDMVTDRISTAMLLALLAREYDDKSSSASAAFLLLLMLDVGSHWIQMYASLAVGAGSHKNLAGEPALLQWYYRKANLFTVCLLNEAHLLTTFALARQSSLPAELTCLSSPRPSWVIPAHPAATAAAGYLPGLIGPLVAGVQPDGPSILNWLYSITFVVFALKQVISLTQLAMATARILLLDTAALQAQSQPAAPVASPATLAVARPRANSAVAPAPVAAVASAGASSSTPARATSSAPAPSPAPQARSKTPSSDKSTGRARAESVLAAIAAAEAAAAAKPAAPAARRRKGSVVAAAEDIDAPVAATRPRRR